MKRNLLYIALILVSTSLFAQDSQIEIVDEGPKSIKGSFDAMLKASNRYQEFKVIKMRSLNEFIVEVQDSLDQVHKELNTEIKAKKNLISEVKQLNDTISSKDLTVAQLVSDRDNISTAGMEMDKKSFSSAMWVALITLLGLLIALFLRNKSLASGQKTVKSTLREVEDELSNVKKKALEREQELKREVQDYVNKIEAMGPPR